MKFAFSTVACPTWDFATIAKNAKSYGYDGVELRAFSDADHSAVNNPFLTDAAKVRAIFGAEGIAIACLASSIAMTGNKRQDAALADDARRHIDLAASLGCSIVKVFDTTVHPGESRTAALQALGHFLGPLGDYAGARNVLLVVENALSFRDAKEIWLLLDRLAHPHVAACWDVFNAALVGEVPATSVSTLNSRIAYCQAKDAAFSPQGATYTKVGEGTVKIQNFLTRLLGIGYSGFVTFEWEKAYLPNIAPPEEILPQAIAKLKEWTAPPAPEEKKPAPKPAAKPAPAPAASAKVDGAAAPQPAPAAK